MIIDIAYGRGGLHVDLPDEIDVTVIRKRPMTPLENPRAAIRKCLDNPIGSAPLRAAARGKQSACILICDITRPVPNGVLLPILVQDLVEAGMSPANVTILVATGLHRPNEGDELRELVGDSRILESVRVVNHFARNDEDHVDLGRTATRGTPVKLDRRFVSADLKIVTGLVEPHFMAGYSGGRKVIAPGIAHADTIRTFHNARFMEDPFAIQCNLEHNPLHEEQLEIVRLLGDVLAVNVVQDEHRRLIHVTFGEIIVSHLAAVSFVRDCTEIPVPRRFHTVVTSAAGYPLDKTYYQTVKGMVTPMDILAPGANLIVASECGEGFGSVEFRESQRRLVRHGPEKFLRQIIGKPLADVDEWQTQMQLKPMRAANIHLFSNGLAESDHQLTGVNRITSIEEAVRQSVSASRDPAVAVIPEGPYVVPYYAAADAPS